MSETGPAVQLTQTQARVVKPWVKYVGCCLAGFVVIVAVVGPFMAPHDPNAFVTHAFGGPSGDAWAGGDALGRDVLSRTLAGGWKLLLMAALATVVGVGVGAVAGMWAALRQGTADIVVMRVVDVLLSFPQLILALLLVSVLGPRLWLIVLAVALSHAPGSARVLRAAALDVSEREFVRVARLYGASTLQIVQREFVPNLRGPIAVEFGLRLTYSMIVIAGLSFLGFGPQPPEPSWGAMINENRIGIRLNVLSVMLPISLIALLTIGVNLWAEGSGRPKTLAGRIRHQPVPDGGK